MLIGGNNEQRRSLIGMQSKISESHLGVHPPLGSSNSQETNMRTVLLTRQLTTMKIRSRKVKGPV